MRVLENIDRRLIYLFVLIALGVPLIYGYTLPPAKMQTAVDFFDAVESLENSESSIVLIASDWGPGTQAENKPQTMVAIEHLMRKRIPFALISISPISAPFLKSMPREVIAKLQAESPGETWSYGKDWVNLGFKPGGYIMIEGLAKAEDLRENLKTDVNGTALVDLPVMQNIKSIRNISMLMEFTGLVGAFNYWVQYFQVEDYRPPFVHGCTSITIPEAYIYYSSKQLLGFHEGLAGAAYYDALMSERYPERTPGRAIRVNTGLAVAQLLVMGFILLGNLGLLIRVILRRTA